MITKLEALNELLAGISEEPTDTVNMGVSVEVDLALKKLEMASQRLQNIGWEFNTFVRKLSAGRDYRVRLPDSILWASFNDPEKNRKLVFKRGLLFNRLEDTFIFPLEWGEEAKLCQYLDWDNLPSTPRYAILATAKRQFCQDLIGSQYVTEALRQDERVAWLEFRQQHGESTHYNYLTDSISVSSIWGRPAHVRR